MRSLLGAGLCGAQNKDSVRLALLWFPCSLPDHVPDLDMEPTHQRIGMIRVPLLE
jgi:hypothetical protein